MKVCVYQYQNARRQRRKLKGNSIFETKPRRFITGLGELYHCSFIKRTGSEISSARTIAIQCRRLSCIWITPSQFTWTQNTYDLISPSPLFIISLQVVCWSFGNCLLDFVLICFRRVEQVTFKWCCIHEDFIFVQNKIFVDSRKYFLNSHEMGKIHDDLK